MNIYPFIKKYYQKYDIIHSHSYIFFTSLQCAFLRKIRKFPLVLHIHGGVQTPFNVSTSVSEYLQLIWKEFFFDKLMGKRTIEHSDAIISVSKKDLDMLKKKYDLSQISTYYIPNAVNTRKFVKDSTIVPKYITFIGRLSFIKGFDIFIDLMQELYNKDNTLKFLIVGDGPLRYLLEKVNKNIPITYYKYIPYDRIQEIYNISKLLILTSRFEGVPTSILESLASETPAIAPNVGGISEILKPNTNGLIYDLNHPKEIIEKLLDLLSNDQKRKKYGKQGRDIILNKFSWDKVTDAIEEVYLNLI